MNQTAVQKPEGQPNPALRVAVIAGVGLVAIVVLVLLTRSIAVLVAGDDGWDVEPNQPVQVTIESGSSATRIYETMHAAGVVRASELEAAAKAAGVEDRLQAGTYSLMTDMDAVAIVRRLVEGGDDLDGSTFTVIEGWTIDRIIDELSEHTAHTRAEYQKALRDGSVYSEYLPTGVEDPIARWEGLLYPAKYPLSEGSSPQDILQAMSDEMMSRINNLDWTAVDGLGISRYDALVIGSLIEWEAGTVADRPLISSVVHNRLNEPMRLQIDATVIYALGHNPGRVLAEHLRIESPYNTYLVDGLPPTPIGAVSEGALLAALNPSETDYLFYVLGNEDGGHVFAVTYEEHQANIAAAKAAGILP